MSSEAFSSVRNEPKESAEEKIVSPTEAILENLKSDDKAHLINGLKTLLAFMSKGNVASEAMPSVVIALGHKDEEVSHLASIITLMMTSDDSDILLLSVDHFLKSLFQSDSATRALSVKTFTSLPIHLTSTASGLLSITLDHLKTTSSDTSPFVRRATAIACAKLVDETNKMELLAIVKKMLQDQSPLVISAAMYAISIIAPDDDTIYHPYFRFLCNAMGQFDQWGQTIALRTFTRYARRCFRDPKHLDFDNWNEDAETIDPDLDLLLSCAQPLLASIVPSVSLYASILFFYCAPPLKRQLMVKPMVRLCYENGGVQCVALSVLSAMVADDPEPFVPHLKHFFINDDDPRDTKLLKFKVLSQLSRPMNSSIIMEELYQHVASRDRELSHAAVMAIGRTATHAGPLSYNSFTQLMRLLNSPLDFVVSSTIHVLCVLLGPLPRDSEITSEEDPLFGDVSEPQMDTEEVKSILKKLLTFFGKIDNPEAKSALIAVVGAKAKIIPLQSHEVLRQLAITFPQQERPVKLQTITLAARVYIVRPKESSDLVRFVFSQGLYDTDIDIRDRVRLCHSLISASTTQKTILDIRKKADRFLFPEKPNVVWDNSSQRASFVDIGTFSQILNLPEAPHCLPWADNSELPPSSVRDGEVDEMSQISQGLNPEKSNQIIDDDFDSFFGISDKQKETKIFTDEQMVNVQNEQEVIDEDYFS